ncbi:MAG: glucose-6-phosphate dehydrogenase assembly protein OpcA [Thermoleophilia bacterium]|nr:glucose-6-phosphate dehydrogenase assembly protein OpcA [Thermoleophilia bacterium]
MSLTVAETWDCRDVRVADVERAIGTLRDDEHGRQLRTSVMTHVAWAPPEWEDAARATLEGLGEQHPSRTLLLLPEPEQPDGLDAAVSLQCFPSGDGGHVCTEVIELRLRGARAEAPASIVAPLLLPNLPVFLRWRGEPHWEARRFQRLVEIVHRLVVDSREWGALRAAYARLGELFGEQLAVSDIAWARGLPWRGALAAAWPAIGQVGELTVAGPHADARLLAGWLRARLGRPVALVHEPADELEWVAVDCTEVEQPPEPVRSPSELLSEQLDRFGRDPVYEAAVRAAAD